MAKAILLLFVGWMLVGCADTYSADVSPDGRTVYEATKDGLFQRPATDPVGRKQLVGGRNIGSPKVSPDGDQLIYSKGNEARILDLKTGSSRTLPPGDCEWANESNLLCESMEQIVLLDASSRKAIHAFPRTAGRIVRWISAKEGYIGMEPKAIKLYPSGKTVAKIEGYANEASYNPATGDLYWLEFTPSGDVPTAATWCRVKLSGGEVERTKLEDPFLVKEMARFTVPFFGSFSPKLDRFAIVGAIDRSPPAVCERYLDLWRKEWANKKVLTRAENVERHELEEKVRVDVVCVLYSLDGQQPRTVSVRSNVPLMQAATDLHWSADGSTLMVEYLDAVSTRRLD
ncbi:MAG: hypothetical protein ACAH95_08275 [Fimbriimonas sp.]